jgi:hypothetical protein
MSHASRLKVRTLAARARTLLDRIPLTKALIVITRPARVAHTGPAYTGVAGAGNAPAGSSDDERRLRLLKHDIPLVYGSIAAYSTRRPHLCGKPAPDGITVSAKS